MNSALIVQDLGGKAEGGDFICTGLEEPYPCWAQAFQWESFKVTYSCLWSLTLIAL